MGWFESGAVHGDGLSSLVSVVSPGQGAVAGAGVHMSHRLVLTCAHVVNDACGRPQFATQAPPPGAAVGAAFPSCDPAVLHPARVVAWIPPRPVGADDGPVAPGAREWAGDLAVLELLTDPPAAARPAIWQDMAEGQQIRSWYGGGQRFSYADARVGSCDGRIGYLDGQLSGAAIGRGYSGSPLWMPGETSVVGLVVGHVGEPVGEFAPQNVVRRSWGFAWQALRAELVAAGFAGLLTDCRDVRAGQAVDDSLRAAALGPLRALLGSPELRADHCRWLAEQLGVACRPDGAPSVDELAAVLFTLNRALPTLAESLAPMAAGKRERAELTKLLGLGRLAEASRLLSVGEYRYLLVKLGRIAARDATLLPRAARAALPYMLLPEALGRDELPAGDLAAAVEALELHGDSVPVPQGTPGVPALLRFVEHVAAAAGGAEATALGEWSDRVAARLGIHDSALHERRRDALTWAGNQAMAVSRVVLAIDRDEEGPADQPESGDTYWTAVWRMHPDRPADRVHLGVSRPRTPQEIARIVRDTVGAGDGRFGDAPLVEVVVPRTGLRTPVDEWDTGEGHDLLPATLGEDFHIALRCPELRTRNPAAALDLRRRWDRRNQTPALTVDQQVRSDRELVKLLKTSHRDCGHVVLHDTDGPRARFLDICLAVGVPVILWDRGAVPPGNGLDKLNPTGPLTGLMERVRYFRVDAYADPAGHPARPSLVWEDADLALPPELKLADPWGDQQ